MTTLQPLYHVLSAFCPFCGEFRGRATDALRASLERAYSTADVLRLLRKASASARVCSRCSRTLPTIALENTRRRERRDGEAWFPLRARFPAEPHAQAHADWLTDGSDRRRVKEPRLWGWSVPLSGERALRALEHIRLETLVRRRQFDGQRPTLWLRSLVSRLVLVSSPHTRPTNFAASPQPRLHERTRALLKVVQCCVALRVAVAAAAVALPHVDSPALPYDVGTLYAELQYSLDVSSDGVNAGVPPSRYRAPSRTVDKGIAGSHGNKEGRWRGNINGKRTNQSARTVITPDPALPFGTLALPQVGTVPVPNPARV